MSGKLLKNLIDICKTSSLTEKQVTSNNITTATIIHDVDDNIVDWDVEMGLEENVRQSPITVAFEVSPPSPFPENIKLNQIPT